MSPRIKRAKVRKRKGPSSLESMAALKMKARGVPKWETERRILAPRRFMFDFVWSKQRVTLEVHGVYGRKSRHLTPSGFQRDRVKMNLAQLAGWIVIEAGTDHIRSGEFVHWVIDALGEQD